MQQAISIINDVFGLSLSAKERFFISKHFCNDVGDAEMFVAMDKETQQLFLDDLLTE